VTTDEPQIRVPDAELDFDDELIYRWRGKLFTGTGFEELPGGGLSEVSYKYGAQEGPARDWYPSGNLKGESHYRENVLHGVAREYGEDGSLTAESFYEFGILVKRREKDENGKMLITFAIQPGEYTYTMLDRYRREKGWPMSELS
jgi:hypothetical protein